jgi:2-dehydro-3-deoxygluconokinase
MTAVGVVGEILWDLHGDAELARATHFRRQIGGAAANVALALARWGIEVAALGVVGNDVLGRGLVDALALAGIDTSALQLGLGQTGSVFVGARGPAGVAFYSYRPTVVWPERLALPASWGRGSLAGRWLHVAAVNPPEIGVITALCQRVRSRGANVSMDVNARPRAWGGQPVSRRALVELLGQATWIKASADDIKTMESAVGDTVFGSASLSSAPPWIVTDGSAPLIVRGGFGEFRVTPEVQALERVGAGDRFSAALLARTWQELPVHRDAWRAAVAHAMSVAARYVSSDVQ